MFIWGQKSSGAVPFGTFFALLVMWFGVSVPLVYLGSYIGYRMPRLEFPTKTNMIPRTVPKQVTNYSCSCEGNVLSGAILNKPQNLPAVMDNQ